MKRRTVPTVCRKHDQGLTKVTFHLSAPDTAGIEKIRSTYETTKGFSLSTSLVVSLAIDALLAETRAGHLRTNPEVFVAKEVQ
jgi:hypothetical protein